MLGHRSTGTGRPIVALHGFTHTAAQFDRIAPLLGGRLVAIDLPGHGSSVEQATDVASVVAAVVDTVHALAGSPVPILGYSQGARIALSVACRTPDLVSALVLVSGTPGIADVRERQERHDADRRTADHIRAIGLDSFLEEWTTSGITSTTHRDPGERAADLARRRDNTADGLARAIVGYGQGATPPTWDAIGMLTAPALVIVGSQDARYVAIGQEMVHTMPGAELCIVPGAGHDPIGDRPQEVAAEVSAFLDRCGVDRHG